MKRFFASIFVLIFISVNVFAMQKSKDEIVVFAAASMTETLEKVKPLFEKKYKGTKVIYNFDSSGTLQKQIENGAYCDIFISAAQKQMNALEDKGLIIDESRKDFLENKTVLAVHPDNPKSVQSFDGLISMLVDKSVLLAIGNDDVPVGQYTKKIFAYYNKDVGAFSSNLTFGSNVKEVTTQVKHKSADAGIVYATDCFSAGLMCVDVATEEMTGGRVVYPLAILKNTSNPTKANAFVQFLSSDKAKNIFQGVGFSTLIN